jgi:hypothetical protein
VIAKFEHETHFSEECCILALVHASHSTGFLKHWSTDTFECLLTYDIYFLPRADLKLKLERRLRM